jgi:hypothetical protein
MMNQLKPLPRPRNPIPATRPRNPLDMLALFTFSPLFFASPFHSALRLERGSCAGKRSAGAPDGVRAVVRAKANP